MQGSIISPIWFYLIDVLGNLQYALTFIVAICIGLVVCCVIWWMICQSDIHDFSESSSYYKKAVQNSKICVKITKVTLPLLIVFLIGAVVIPSKEAMYKMMIANYVTYENVEIATDVIQDSVDYIAEKFN